MLFPGEAEAIDTVIRLAEEYGYGNLIDRLQTAWSEKLQKHHGFDAYTSDKASGHICAWCEVDNRTGKKATP